MVKSKDAAKTKEQLLKEVAEKVLQIARDELETGAHERTSELKKTYEDLLYEILKNIEYGYPIAEIVYEHHERMNGSGYPRGLSGDQILIEARIIAVADVVESMASPRPYRPSLGTMKALNEIKENRGTLYDMAVVDICLRLFNEKGFRFEYSVFSFISSEPLPP